MDEVVRWLRSLPRQKRNLPTMPVYEMGSDTIQPLKAARFSQLGLHERSDLQRLLRECIDVISPDTLVISEEFRNWSEGSRRIDLLGVHKTGDLVVVELKRDDAGHMELQALRYAAMVSTMTLAQAVDAYQSYLSERGRPSDGAEEEIKAHLEPDAAFGDAVRIVLASSDFHKEVTSTVLWLNSLGLNISCVRMTPYESEEKVFLDVDRFIPLAGAEDYQIAVQNKVVSSRIAESERRARNRQLYSLSTPSEQFDSCTKRDLIFNVVRVALQSGVGIDEIQDAIPWKKNLFVSAKGTLTIEQFYKRDGGRAQGNGIDLNGYYFKVDSKVLHCGGMTYLMRRDWGGKTEVAVRNVLALLPEGHGMSYSLCD